MEYLNFPDFINQQSTLDYMFKTEAIAIDDDEELNTINPDDFLNESFFKTETEVVHEKCRIKTYSESSSSGNFSENASPQPMQLTPPISPQPIVNNNNNIIKLIPITSLQNNHIPKYTIRQQQIQKQQQHERKIKPILPAKTTSPQSGSSDSETNVINDNSSISSKATSPVDKALVKQARLIRNRESALQSRRKKKEYVQNLEVEIGYLRKELDQLKEENSVLKQKLKSYSNFTCRCASSISSKLSTVKSTSLLFALVFMIGFNFIPFGTYFTFTNNHMPRSIADQPAVAFNTRHLLFVENTTTTTAINSDEANLSSENENEIPLYFNQTDRIRKTNIENVLRWIPQPDLFNTSRKIYNDYDFTEDPLQNKLAKMFEKSRNQMHQPKKPLKKNSAANKRKNVAQKKKSNAENIQENLINPNFFKLHEFFDEIKRKEDTFYVFSFKGEHLLLPAIENFSQIIKMNLIMPRNNESLTSDKITMFQIETVIVNTSLIEVAEKSIPGELIKTYSNSTTTPVMCNQNIKKLSNEKFPKQIVASTAAEEVVEGKRAKFAPYFQFDRSRFP